MSENNTYQIQPEILSFLRKSSGMSEDDVAKKLKLSTTAYINIEKGTSILSQNHLIQLADIYRRPLIAFYSTEITSIPELPHDYRLNRDKTISPGIFLAKRKAIYLAEQLKDVTGRKTKLPKINTNLSSVKLAEEIRNVLKVDYNFIRELKEEPIINYYKSIIEEIFFIPIIEHPLKSNGVRAFSVYNDVCVIILNESDTREVKLFSLFHELCHLLKKQDGICSIDIEKNKKNPEESYCDEFAAHMLVPASELKNLVLDPIISLTQVAKLAKLFGVSNLVTAIRLKELNIINNRTFNGFKMLLNSSIKKGFGRRNWENTYINRTSRLVLSNLINSYKKGDLTYSSLASITGIKDKYLQKFV